LQQTCDMTASASAYSPLRKALDEGQRPSYVYHAMPTDATTCTVGGMAARIARTGRPDEIATIIRQLRNWTGLGLLTPIGEKHEGTGRHRLYDHAELMKAALLEVLARNFRVDVTGLQSFAKRFSTFFPEVLIASARSREQYPFWMGFRNGEIVQHGFDPEPNTLLDAMKNYELVVIVDAGPIAKRIFG
jgi:hypothetical protein